MRHNKILVLLIGYFLVYCAADVDDDDGVVVEDDSHVSYHIQYYVAQSSNEHARCFCIKNNR